MEVAQSLDEANSNPVLVPAEAWHPQQQRNFYVFFVLCLMAPLFRVYGQDLGRGSCISQHEDKTEPDKDDLSF